jgi:hypothetical protein
MSSWLLLREVGWRCEDSAPVSLSCSDSPLFLSFPFHVVNGFRGFCISLFWDLVVFSTIFFFTVGFLCLLERSHEARSFANQQARRFTGWDGPTKEKAQLVLEEYCEWEEFHPAFFDEEDISAQETSSMDEGGRNSCIIKCIL